jgi:hypothetical protein
MLWDVRIVFITRKKEAAMIAKIIGLLSGNNILTWGVVGVAAVLIGYCVFSVNSLYTERNMLRQENNILKLNNDQLTIDLKSANTSIADNWTGLNSIESRLLTSQNIWKESEKRLEELNENNSEVCTWASSPVPDDVWRWLCEDLANSLPRPAAVNSPGGLSKDNPGTEP